MTLPAGFEEIEINTKLTGVHVAARDLVDGLVQAIGVGHATAVVLVAAGMALADMIEMPSPMPEMNHAGAQRLVEMLQHIVTDRTPRTRGPVQ